MNHSTPGLHPLLQFTQTHVHWDGNAISFSVIPCSSCLQSFPGPGSFQINQLLHQMAKVLEFQVQHQSFQWTLRTDLLSVQQFSRSVVSDSLWPHELQHTKSPCPSPNPKVHPNLCPLSQCCHPAVSFSVIPFSSCPRSFPASWSFSVSQLFASGGQNIGVSASTSVLPMNTQDWSPLGWTGWISLQSKGLPRVFSNTTVQKHQFFGAQPSL